MPSGDQYNDILLQISCILSILGSLLVMYVCNSKQMMIKQKGKYLIFWLSFSDLSSSTVYLVSSLSLKDNNNNSIKCQVYALLGIFFPVASFLWTDFIAYYLYSMIVSRKLKTETEWKELMIYFHIISWGVSALCILIVAAFRHAGRSDTEEGDNTGGWCWVAASSKSLIFWEIIGGKFVEWTSAFIILPYFYFVTARTLVKLDQSWNNLIDRKKISLKKDSLWDSLSNTTTSLRISIQTYFYPEQMATRSQNPNNEINEEDDINDEYTDGERSSYYHDDGIHHSFGDNQDSGTLQQRAPLLESNPLQQPTKYEECHNTPKFRKFYAKMALVPILFFVARIWGSMRIIIYAISDDNDNGFAIHSANTWLKTMQAIFDTSQGFLNAIVFVFLSTENRKFITEIFCLCPLWVINIICCGRVNCNDTTVSALERDDDQYRLQSHLRDENESSMCYSSERPHLPHHLIQERSQYLSEGNHNHGLGIDGYDNYNDDDGDDDNDHDGDVGNDQDDIAWDGQMSYQKSNNYPSSPIGRQIKCSFTEGNC